MSREVDASKQGSLSYADLAYLRDRGRLNDEGRQRLRDLEDDEDSGDSEAPSLDELLEMSGGEITDNLVAALNDMRKPELVTVAEQFNERFEAEIDTDQKVRELRANLADEIATVE